MATLDELAHRRARPEGKRQFQLLRGLVQDHPLAHGAFADAHDLAGTLVVGPARIQQAHGLPPSLFLLRLAHLPPIAFLCHADNLIRFN